MHGLEELQRLAQVNRAGAGKLGTQHGGNQRAAQHAVGNDLVKRAALGVQHIDMRRVHVARDGGKQLNVARRHLALQAGAVANADFGKRMVFKEAGRRVCGAAGVHAVFFLASCGRLMVGRNRLAARPGWLLESVAVQGIKT